MDMRNSIGLGFIGCRILWTLRFARPTGIRSKSIEQQPFRGAENPQGPRKMVTNNQPFFLGHALQDPNRHLAGKRPRRKHHSEWCLRLIDHFPVLIRLPNPPQPNPPSSRAFSSPISIRKAMHASRFTIFKSHFRPGIPASLRFGNDCAGHGQSHQRNGHA